MSNNAKKESRFSVFLMGGLSNYQRIENSIFTTEQTQLVADVVSVLDKMRGQISHTGSLLCEAELAHAVIASLDPNSEDLYLYGDVAGPPYTGQQARQVYHDPKGSPPRSRMTESWFNAKAIQSYDLVIALSLDDRAIVSAISAFQQGAVVVAPLELISLMEDMESAMQRRMKGRWVQLENISEQNINLALWIAPPRILGER